MMLSNVYQVKSPIVFMNFRRPELTALVFERIAMARPSKMYIFADGPRSDTDREKCAQVRQILDKVDWECEVYRHYADENMGLRNRFTSALNYVFSQEESAIILEDDCLPEHTFFQYCDTLLEKHRDQSQIFHICGANYGFQRPYGVQDSYYFTHYVPLIGWASWRRAWAHYDVTMAAWQDAQARARVLALFPNPLERNFWERIFNGVYDGKINSWGYIWMFTCMVNGALSVLPYENVICNLGFGVESTNTQDPTSLVSNRPMLPIRFPLAHPVKIVKSQKAVRFYSRFMVSETTKPGRAVRKARRVIRNHVRRIIG